MFKRLAKSGLVNFWPLQPQRIAPGLGEVSLSNPAHSNDNLSGLRRPAATSRRRHPTPALACHWFDRDGRLEYRWQVDGDAPIAGVDEHQRRTTGAVPPAGRLLRRQPLAARGFHMAVFLPFYQERDGSRGAAHGWLRSAGASTQEVEQEFHRERVD